MLLSSPSSVFLGKNISPLTTQYFSHCYQVVFIVVYTRFCLGFWFDFGHSIYRIVASRSTSQLVTCLGLFRLLMKGIFGPYVLWPLDKKLIFWIVTRVSAPDYTVCVTLFDSDVRLFDSDSFNHKSSKVHQKIETILCSVKSNPTTVN